MVRLCWPDGGALDFTAEVGGVIASCSVASINDGDEDSFALFRFSDPLRGDNALIPLELEVASGITPV